MKFFYFITFFLLLVVSYKIGDKKGYEDGLNTSFQEYIDDYKTITTDYTQKLDSLKIEYYRLYFAGMLNKCPEEWK